MEYSTSRSPDRLTQILDLDFGFAATTLFQYTYSNGNVVKLERRDGSFINVENLTYSAKPNPFYGLLYGVPEDKMYSKNLLINSRFFDTYDSNGLLINRVDPIGGPAAPQNNKIERFEYEAY
ncbi:hypothetical protein [Spirosoma areae]